MSFGGLSRTASVLVAIAIAGVIGVIVVANVQASLTQTAFPAAANTSIANIFTQSYSAFNMWPIVLIVVIAAVVLMVIKFVR